MSDFHNQPRTGNARKDKRCIWCGEDIKRGDEQVSQSGRFDGYMYRNHWHPECWSAAERVDFDDGFSPYMFTRGCECEHGAEDCNHATAEKGVV